MEFSVDAFLNSLVSYMAVAFPYMEDEEKDRAKHPKREPLHLKDAIFNDLQVAHSLNSATFDIGNERLERTHPYYHILENSQVIRKAHRSTEKSRGSQAKVQDVGKRDYERVNWNGKTYSKEYSRNVRGSRSLLDKASHWTVDTSGKLSFANRDANYYANIHYHYIEKMLEGGILDMLAADFGLKKMRKQDSGLAEEFALQENNELNLVDILNSFAEE